VRVDPCLLQRFVEAVASRRARADAGGVTWFSSVPIRYSGIGVSIIGSLGAARAGEQSLDGHLKVSSVPGRSSPDAFQGSLDEATPGTKGFGEGVASVALIHCDDVEDVAVDEPGNLCFPAKNLIFRPHDGLSLKPSPPPRAPVDQHRGFMG
jgi:hypothetical protein